jgi:hypothetical protein
MSKDNAIEYLRYLHKLEQEQRESILTYELAVIVERIRLEFIELFRK